MSAPPSPELHELAPLDLRRFGCLVSQCRVLADPARGELVRLNFDTGIVLYVPAALFDALNIGVQLSEG